MTCLKLNEKKSHIYALQVFFTIIKPGSSKCRSLEKNNYIYIYWFWLMIYGEYKCFGMIQESIYRGNSV